MALTGEQYQLPLISFAVPAAHACAAALPAMAKMKAVPAAATRPRMLIFEERRFQPVAMKKGCVSKSFKDVMFSKLFYFYWFSRDEGNECVWFRFIMSFSKQKKECVELLLVSSAWGLGSRLWMLFYHRFGGTIIESGVFKKRIMKMKKKRAAKEQNTRTSHVLAGIGIHPTLPTLW